MKAKELIKYLKKFPDNDVTVSVDMDVGMADDITGRRVFGHNIRETMFEENRNTTVLLCDHESTNYEGPVACVPKKVRKTGTLVLHTLADYREGYGQALWYRLPITEPPFVSCPLSSDWLLELHNGDCVHAEDVGLESVGGLCKKSDVKGPWATHWSPLPRVTDKTTIKFRKP